MKGVKTSTAATIFRLAFICAGLSAFSAAWAVDHPQPPASEPAKPPVVMVQADGTLLLKAEGARILGYKMRLENNPTPVLARWVDSREAAEWPMAVAHKGKYKAQLTYSAREPAGGDFTLSAGAAHLDGRAVSTGDWQTFKTLDLGTLAVLNDKTSIVVRPRGDIPRALMNLKEIKLTPLPPEHGKEK